MAIDNKSILGIKWTGFSTFIVSITQILQLSILSRFLIPSDFGLMAIVLVVVGFSQTFVDMGISNAIIYKQNISKNQLSTLYWINIFSGFLIFLFIFFISPLIAKFYNEPILLHLNRLVAISFIIQPFGQQFMVLLQKELRFKEISIIEVISKTTSLLISVIFAYFGYGIYSFIFGTLGAIFLQTCLYFLIGLKDFGISFTFSFKEINEFLNFGLYQMGEKTINYFNFQIDVILIGRLLGSEQLGIYNIAKQIIIRPSSLINQIVTKVSFPSLALIQNKTEKLKGIYLKIINYLSMINFPLFALIYVFANDLILILFGEAYVEAIRIVKILSIYGAVRSVGNPVGSLLLALGRAKLAFIWNLILIFIIPVVIFIGSIWGLEGVAWGLVIVVLLLTFPNWYFLVKSSCQASFLEYHKQLILPIMIFIITVGVGYTLNFFLKSFLLRLTSLIIFTSSFIYFLSLIFNKNFIKFMINFKKTKFS